MFRCQAAWFVSGSIAVTCIKEMILNSAGTPSSETSTRSKCWSA